MRRSVAWMGLVTMAGTMLGGCRVEKTGDGGSEKVKMSTPFGGLQVKTNETAAESGIGIPVYPGAKLVKKNGKDKDSGAADINLNLGAMRMRIKVLSYRTEDVPEKVEGFYRKELGRYGTVIACKDEAVVGEPTRTPEGLTCDKGKDGRVVHASDGKGSIELKAGSPQHQHAVSVEKEGDGTKFALVMVDLPKRFSLGDSDDESVNEGQRESQ